MKHTQGPWKAHTYNDEEYIDIDSGCERICSVFIGSDVWTEITEEEINEKKANASLIACAPELLEILEQVMYGVGTTIKFHDKSLPDKVEAVIAKARGVKP